jgi:N-acetylglucosaminyldiphosphoundecaprenol N-acetyl-beta-D-mannosaminyltransferase
MLNELEKKFFINVNFSLVERDDLLNKILNFNDVSEFEYIVTANADHMVRLPKNSNFQKAYDQAAYVTCDSRVIKLLAKISRYNLGEVITGSDLTKDVIFRLSGKNVPVIIIGSEPEEINELAKTYNLINVKHYNPPMGFIKSNDEISKCVKFVESARKGIVFFCVGAPQQEILANAIKSNSNFSGVGLCVGASIHFLTGKVERAPLWMQKIAMEWAFRLFKEPKRLFKRYFMCLEIFWMYIIFLINCNR